MKNPFGLFYRPPGSKKSKHTSPHKLQDLRNHSCPKHKQCSHASGFIYVLWVSISLNKSFIAVWGPCVEKKSKGPVRLIKLYLFLPNSAKPAVLNTAHMAFPSTLIAFIQFISTSHARPWSVSATKTLLSFDGSYWRKRKSRPDAVQPISVRRADLHAFLIQVLDRTSPSHHRADHKLASVWTYTCVLSAAAQIGAVLGFH